MLNMESLIQSYENSTVLPFNKAAAASQSSLRYNRYKKNLKDRNFLLRLMLEIIIKGNIIIFFYIYKI